MASKEYYYGLGRRKSAGARVRLRPGTGTIVVNGRPMEEYFVADFQRHIVMQPFYVAEGAGKYNASIKVAGGGLSGQAGATAHGIARSLVEFDENLRLALKKAGLLTRDARIKERKKPGLKRARKAPQYTKR